MTTDLEAAFLARRTRLLIGMTQRQFAETMGVEDATVSRWERGKLHPSPKLWSRIREIALRSATPFANEVIKASKVYKFVAAMDHLTHPTVVSSGAVEALARVGIKPAGITGAWWAQGARTSPYYDSSAIHALEVVQANKIGSVLGSPMRRRTPSRLGFTGG